MSYKLFMAKLGLTVPVVQAPMAGVSTVKLAAEVARCGGLGSLPMSPVDLTSTPEKVFEQIAEFRKLAGQNAIVNCNFFCFDPSEQHPTTAAEREAWCKLYLASAGLRVDKVQKSLGNEVARAVVSFSEFERQYPRQFSAFLYELIKTQVGVVSFHFGVPSSDAIRMLQKGGVLVVATATSVREASFLADLNVDAIVLQGYEAGGHRGNFMVEEALDENLSTSALFGQVNAGVKNVPLIPAGGIMDGQSMIQYLQTGAAAVQLGTVFIPVEESSAPDFIAKSVEANNKTSTIMTSLVTGRAARMLQTPFVQGLVQQQKENNYTLPTFGYSTSAVRKVAAGDRKYGYFLAGQNYHQIKTGLAVKQVMEGFQKSFDVWSGQRALKA